MTARAVHWHEGMFLQPHHFQADHRYLTARTHRAMSWPVHHTWGLRSVEIDTDALAAKVKQQLSSFKVPRQFFVLPDAEVPWLPSQKVDKRTLNALAEKLAAEPG